MKSRVREHFFHHQVPFHNHSGFWLTFFSQAGSFSKHSDTITFYKVQRWECFPNMECPSRFCPLADSISSGSLGDSTSQGVAWGFVGLVWLFSFSLCPILLSSLPFHGRWLLIQTPACQTPSQCLLNLEVRSEFLPSLFSYLFHISSVPKLLEV